MSGINIFGWEPKFTEIFRWSVVWTFIGSDFIGATMEMFVASPILLFLLPFFTVYVYTGSNVPTFFNTDDWSVATVVLRRIWFDCYVTTIIPAYAIYVGYSYY